MKKLGYLLLVIALLAAVSLAATNYYQTQQAKRAKIPQLTTNNNQIKSNDLSPQPKNSQSTAYTLAVVDISGFDCPSCPAIAKAAIKNSQGVVDAAITETGNGSRIIYNPAITNLEAIKKSLPESYKVQLVSQETTTATKLN